MTVNLSVNEYKSPHTKLKEMALSNPRVTFCPSMDQTGEVADMRTPISIEIHANTMNYTTPSKDTGRRKNTKLSALAARRSGPIKKPPKASNDSRLNHSEQVETRNDETHVENDGKVEISNSNGLSRLRKMALSQNLRHMATQVRAQAKSCSDLEPNDLIALASGLNCDGGGNDILRKYTEEPSRGFGMLFPGRNASNRDLSASKSLYPQKFSKFIEMDHDLKRYSGIEVLRFDFNTSPVDDVMEAHNREIEASKRKRKGQPKRLMSISKATTKCSVKKYLNKEVLPAKRLLKRRTTECGSRVPRIAIIGPQNSGKSSLLGQLIYYLNSESCEKIVTKLKWEAQKCGRPHDFIAWLVDELDGERQFSRSRDVGEASVVLPSGRTCHLFDCPGDIDRLSLNSDIISIADEIILVVDVMSFIEKGCNEERRIRDLFRLLEQKRQVCESIPTYLTVVVNKMDNCSWSKSVALKAGKILASIKEETDGLKNLNLRILPVSTRSAEGLFASKSDSDSKKSRNICRTSLIDVLEKMTAVKPIDSEPQDCDLQPSVVVVNDVYENMGAGFTAVVHIKEGLLSPGQSLICFPSNTTAQVRTIQVVSEGKLKSVAAAVRGELVHVVLWQVEFNSVKRGSILCDPAVTWSVRPTLELATHHKCVASSNQWTAVINVHDLNGRSIIPGRQVIFHAFSFTSPAYLRRLLWTSAAGRTIKDRKKPPTLNTTEENVEDLSGRWDPRVVSSANVSVGIELCIEDVFACLPGASVNIEFCLFDGRTLFATGYLEESLPSHCEGKNSMFELRDRHDLTFHRSFVSETEPMEIDDDFSDS